MAGSNQRTGEQADVVIIGGGPAGSMAGCLLSQAGISNVLLERAVHPRAHVGESMVTATTRIFDEIGFLPVMEREGFPRKFGASWHPPMRSGEFAIRFGEFPQEGVNQDYTYHVDRAKFDMLLLKHAEEMGTQVIQGVQVQGAELDGDQVVGVNATVAGEKITVPARIVIDASGRNTILGNQFGLKVRDPIFNQFAVHAWYEGVDRGSDETKDYIHIYFLPVERGWVWQIPITDTITSIGVVAEREVFKQSRQRVEDYFAEHIGSTPDIAKAMAGATRVNDFKSEADYSYSMSKFVGNGFVMVGDAARFVDPIFSSGVSVAAYSAKYAVEAVIEALAKDDVSAGAFAEYEHKVRSGVGVWYEFIRLYYKMMHLFTIFIEDETHRHQVLSLLQGEVYQRERVPVLDAMREMIDTVESTPNHIWQQYLTDIPID